MPFLLLVFLNLTLWGCSWGSPPISGDTRAENGTHDQMQGAEFDAGIGPALESGEVDAGPEVHDAGEANPLSELRATHETGVFDWQSSELTLDLSETAESQNVPETVQATLYRPVASGSYPVLLFSPGFMLSPADFASYGAHLASWGYVALMIKLPGNMLNPTTHATLSEILLSIVSWLEVPENHALIGGQADTDLMGLIGHSMGGKISLLAAANDQRIKAVFGIDPVDAAGGSPGSQPNSDYPSVTPERMSDILVPIALVGETNNAEGNFLTPACAPQENNFEQYFLHATGPAIQIEILAASHMSFLDDPTCLACLACPAGTDDPLQTKRLTQGYAVSFFESVLRDKNEIKAQWLQEILPQDSSHNLISWESKNEL